MAAETPAKPSNPLDPRVLARVSGLRFRVRRIVEGFITGLHRSPYHGFSVEFAQHRQYTPGDDIRYVDWKVFGKTDRFFIKEYEEETNMKASILMDRSESMKYAAEGLLSKYEYGSCIAAALAFLLLNQQDSVGLTIFDNEIREEMPPTTNPGMLRNFVRLLEQGGPGAGTRIDHLFLKVLSGIRRRGLLILISDFFVDLPALETSLAQCASRGHTVFMFHVMDQDELEFPFQRQTLFKGLEQTGDILLNPNAVRRAYQQEVQAYLTGIRQAAVRHRINYFLMNTSLPLDVALASVLATQGGGRRS